MSIWELQNYPPPTELPAMRAGEVSGRYMDCSTVLGPISDSFTNITDLTVTVARMDGATLDATDLALASGWAPMLDETGTIVTYVWAAPSANTGSSYYLTLSGPTQSGETFVRDWRISVLPLMG